MISYHDLTNEVFTFGSSVKTHETLEYVNKSLLFHLDHRFSLPDFVPELLDELIMLLGLSLLLAFAADIIFLVICIDLLSKLFLLAISFILNFRYGVINIQNSCKQV